MTPDEQEALSRVYSNDVMILLPLSSGSIAVFNNARTLCGIVADARQARLLWYPPAKRANIRGALRPSLEEIGL